MRPPIRFFVIPLGFALAGCADQPTPAAPANDKPDKPPMPIGVYQVAVTGLGTGEFNSDIQQVPPQSGEGPSAALTNAGAGLGFELIGASAFTEGSRSENGQRYAAFHYRVRNGTGVPLSNLTVVLVNRTSSIAGTFVASLQRRDGTPADPSIASQVVPTGSVALGSDLTTMHALYPDVIQVLTEAEAGAISLPPTVNSAFPIGYMVRHKTAANSRELPTTPDPNQWDGVLTLAFRVPLQATAAQDVNSITFEILAVTDSETRLTESIEESQDTAAVRRLRERATALGATTVTVLNGSSTPAPEVPDYPGQRVICSPRTAGTAASPTNSIVMPGAYTTIKFLFLGETLDYCNPYFLSGTASRPATNVPFNVGVRAMDRYGNLRTSVVDTIRLEQVGVPAALGPATPLSAGVGTLSLTYSDYGSSLLIGRGRRLMGWRTLQVLGVTRTWTASAGTTDWHTNANWSPAAVPMSLDSVQVPSAPIGGAIFPVLSANVSVQGVTVSSGATISLGSFDLTAAGNVNASTVGSSGGITNTTGRLILSGIARTVEGNVPRVRVTGTYSLTGNVNGRAPLESSAGRITSGAYRLRFDSF